VRNAPVSRRSHTCELARRKRAVATGEADTALVQIGGLEEMVQIERISYRADRTALSDGGRTDIFEAERREIELTFSNAMHQLNACERDRGVSEPFEAEHDIGPGLDVAMVLLDLVVEIFRGPDLRVLRQQAIRLHLPPSTV